MNIFLLKDHLSKTHLSKFHLSEEQIMPRPRSLAKSPKATDTNGRTAPPRAKPLAGATLPPPIVKSASGAPPLTRVASALARRFHLICSTMIAEVLTGEEVVQLEYGTLLCLEI